MPKKLLPVSVGISNSSGILGEEETRRQTGKGQEQALGRSVDTSSTADSPGLCKASYAAVLFPVSVPVQCEQDIPPN